MMAFAPRAITHCRASCLHAICVSGAVSLAGAPLFAVARVASAGSAGAAMPLTFSAHFDDNWEFTTHELVFVTEPSVAQSELL